MSTAIELSGLTAGYRGLPVVRGLDLSVGEGEVVALLGANGAGKSTTLLTAAGVLRPFGGDVSVLGRSIAGRPADRIARDGLVLVPEDRGVFHQLTVQENLRLARHRGRNGLGGVLELFPALEPLLRRRCGLLSGGEQQMVGLAKALLAEPRALLIDELTLGLAPVIVERLLPVIRRIAVERKMAVLLVEQHVPIALSVADRAYVLSHGQLVLQGPTSELRRRADLLEVSYLGEHPRSEEER
jgi:branched-chain amino acid transport system ATP-binding protein